MNYFNPTAALLVASCAMPAAASTLNVVYDTLTESAATILQAPVPVAGGRIIGQSYGAADPGQVYLLTPGVAGATYTKSPIHAWGQANGSTPATDGANPSGNLTADAQGNLWGTTNSQGANGTGTLFELIHPPKPAGAWTYKVVFSLPASLSASNSNGYGNLIFDSAGNLYGFSIGGTASNGCFGTGCGAIWEIPAATLAGGTGQIATLVTIPKSLLVATSMIRDANGNFFGVGNLNGSPGVAWEASAVAGTYGIRAIHSFCSNVNQLGQCVDGSGPSSIVVAPTGILYGATTSGGANPGITNCCFGTVDGVIFRLKPAAQNRWVFRVLHTFLWQDTSGVNTADVGLGYLTGLSLSGNKLLATVQDGSGATPGCTPGVNPGSASCFPDAGAVLRVTIAGADSIVNRGFGNLRSTPPATGPGVPLFAPIVDKAGGILGASADYYTGAFTRTGAGVIYRITP